MFTVHIRDPETQRDDPYQQGDEYDEISITRLMNFLAFTHEQSQALDISFFALYNEETKKFEYHVERMKNQELPEITPGFDGKQWVLYLDDERKTWTDAVENDLKVNQHQKIVWVFENLN